jgi:hypothetical protein
MSQGLDSLGSNGTHHRNPQRGSAFDVDGPWRLE